MDYDDTYEQEVGRMVVASAVRHPGEDVAWTPLPTIAAALWMAGAVEIAVLEARSPSMCATVFAAMEGGA